MACATGMWAGVGSSWKQSKIKVREMLKNCAESYLLGTIGMMAGDHFPPKKAWLSGHRMSRNGRFSERQSENTVFGLPHFLVLYYAIAVHKIRGSFQRFGLVIRSTSNGAIWRNTLPRETKAIGLGVSWNLAYMTVFCGLENIKVLCTKLFPD